MLDPLIEWIGKLITLMAVAVRGFLRSLAAPFVYIYKLYKKSGWIIRAGLLLVLIPLAIIYIWFVWQVSWIRGYDVNYPDRFDFDQRMQSAGKPVSIEGGGETTRTCGKSAIVDITTALIRFNVDENSWVSSMPAYKAGLFGLDWDATPWFDNKASFQRGVHQAVRRTTVELTDTLGRIRGTSEVDKDLQDARSSVQFDEFTWYINPFDSKRPFGPTTQTPTYYRSAIGRLDAFNDRLSKCKSTFDARADNLMTLLDRIAKDIGSTSAAIRDRAEKSNAGWFDMRADNLFMYAKGQMYGYYGVLQAAHADFRDVIKSRQLEDLWLNMEKQTLAVLELDPFIISNGREDGWMMPTHLTTIGFYILRVRSNLVEIRSVLDR